MMVPTYRKSPNYTAAEVTRTLPDFAFRTAGKAIQIPPLKDIKG